MKGESDSVTEANAIRTHGNRIRKIYQFGAVLIAVAMISSALTLVAIGDGPSDFETVIEPGSMLESASFVIYTDDTTVYAKNGTTGAIAYSSTDIGVVIQAATDSIAAGLIFIKAGNYTQSTAIIISKPVSLVGEGPGATVIYCDTAIVMLNLTDLRGPFPNAHYRVMVKDLSLFGAAELLGPGETVRVATDCLYLHSVGYCLFENLNIGWANGDGITIEESLGNTFIRVYSAFNVNRGLDTKYFESQSTTNRFYSCSFRSNEDADGGVFLYGGIHSTQFIDCLFESNTGTAQVYMWGNYATTFDGCHFETSEFGNDAHLYITGGSDIVWVTHCVFSAGTLDVADIQVASTAKNITVRESHFFVDRVNVRVMATGPIKLYDNIFGGTIQYDYGTLIAEGNIGYVTENYNSTTVTGAVNTLTVNHGLVEAPTYVSITGNNTGIGDYWVTTIAATTFTISFENQPGASTWTFYWYAEVR